MGHPGRELGKVENHAYLLWSPPRALNSGRLASLHCCLLSRSVMSDSATVWTVARQAPLSTEFSRQEYWSGLPFPPPGDPSHSGIEPASPGSLALPADSTTEPLGKSLATLQTSAFCQLPGPPWLWPTNPVMDYCIFSQGFLIPFSHFWKMYHYSTLLKLS